MSLAYWSAYLQAGEGGAAQAPIGGWCPPRPVQQQCVVSVHMAPRACIRSKTAESHRQAETQPQPPSAAPSLVQGPRRAGGCGGRTRSPQPSKDPPSQPHRYSGRSLKMRGGAMMLRLTSPQAPSVDPMFLMTVEKTVFRFCLSTPCSWKVCRVVRRSEPLPYCRAGEEGRRREGGAGGTVAPMVEHNQQ